MAEILYATADNAEGQLNAGITGASSSIVLKSGEGAEFPQPYTGSCSSTGDVDTLNDTGDLGSLAVGDFIRNVTDGSYAFVTALTSADTVETTRLRGGTLNVWTSGDVWQVNEFVVTLEKRDADGDVTQREKVLISNRATDTLTVRTRGYDGDSGQSFDADDYVNLHVTSITIEEMIDTIYTMVEAIDTNLDNIATNDTELTNLRADTPTWLDTITGTDTLTGGVTPALAAYADGQRLSFVVANNNAGAVTLNVDSVGAKALVAANGDALEADDLVAGGIVSCRFDETSDEFIMDSPLHAAAAAADYDLLFSTTALVDAGKSSTSEVSIFTHQIDANTLVAGDIIVVMGTVEGREVSGTETTRVKFGGTTVLSDTGNYRGFFHAMMNVKSIGATGVMTGIMSVCGSTSRYDATVNENAGESNATVDTTVNADVEVSVQYSSSNSLNRWVTNNLCCYRITGAATVT